MNANVENVIQEKMCDIMEKIIYDCTKYGHIWERYNGERKCTVCEFKEA